LGGPIIGGATLSRFFTIHVFIFPALLLVFLAIHLQLVIKKGISEPPVPGKPVDPATYEAEYHKEVEHSGVPFFPYPILRDLIFSALAVLVVVGISLWFGPYGPNAKPDPTLIPTSPRPDWYFLSAFALMALCPPELEAFAMLVMPVIGILFLLAVPFLFGRGERHFSRRPVAVMLVVLIFVAYGVLTYLGMVAPWSPHMYAWSGTPIPREVVEKLTPLELQGAVVFQNKDCRNCHAIDGLGGQRGPDLTHVGTLLDRDELVRQVLQGGGNMPAYGKQLSPPEVEALVSFLETLRPKGEPAAQPSVKAAE
ncbi:MAG: c-type cytochrome, partial [Gemmataceae bacterium]